MAFFFAGAAQFTAHLTPPLTELYNSSFGPMPPPFELQLASQEQKRLHGDSETTHTVVARVVYHPARVPWYGQRGAREPKRAALT